MNEKTNCPDVHDDEDLVGNLKREQSIKSLSSYSKIGPSEKMTMLRYYVSRVQFCAMQRLAHQPKEGKG